MRVSNALLLTLAPLSQMISATQHKVALLALASRKKDLVDSFLLTLAVANAKDAGIFRVCRHSA